MTRFFIRALLAITLGAASSKASAPARIVSVGGSLTEIIFALGEESRLAGVDATSQFPAAARKLPQVGYQRALSAEGVLSLKPDIVIASGDAGPPPALQQLRDAGARIFTVPEDDSLDGVKRKIHALAEVLEVPEKGGALAAQFQRDVDALAAATRAMPSHPKCLFFMGAGQGAPLAAGNGTAAAAIIALAGGKNVTTHDGYKPLSGESAVALAPDFILTTARTLDGCGGVDGLLRLPGLALTPAGKARRVIAMDDMYLLGFGPRAARAAAELAAHIQTPAAVSPR